ncbi:hypothetical protein SADUNF_Sadunf18G0108800 [Salix dunnii]|uniref:CCT domain-containing protein n=1 Tax=Salix dunnii TaxID=1413687 RepID=A0A835MMM4_9ROSI|nr:hypothetical protein SADUNF_Sadunf18G0108800 [Salix dunnii]
MPSQSTVNRANEVNEHDKSKPKRLVPQLEVLQQTTIVSSPVLCPPHPLTSHSSAPHIDKAREIERVAFLLGFWVFTSFYRNSPLLLVTSPKRMSSPCLSGGGRTYGFDLEIVKSSSTSSRTSHTSSPSSTITESSNSPLAISTRKPRTTRKRPNQTYNEAAALLSTAYPNVFSSKHLTKSSKFTKPHDNSILLDQSPDLLLPFRVFDNSGFLLHQPIQEKPRFGNESKVANFRDKSSCQSSGEVDFNGNSKELCDGFDEDFDAESILDEEIEEGIDSIMGNLSVSNEMVDEVPNGISPSYGHGGGQMNSWYGDSTGYNFGGKSQFGHGMAMRRGVRALRQVDEGNWWHFPIVDIPGCNSIPKPKPKSKLKMKPNSSSEKKKKKVESPGVVEVKSEELEEENPIKENSIPESNRRLILKLNYDNVLNAWSDRGSPFSDETMGSAEGTDVSARLAQIDLFSENGMREASVLRYKEKRRTRLFSKKIRYQGRFVRRPNSSTSSDEQEERKKKTFKFRFVGVLRELKHPLVQELKSNKPSKLGSIDDGAAGGNVTLCGKWRKEGKREGFCVVASLRGLIAQPLPYSGPEIGRWAQNVMNTATITVKKLLQ